MSEIIVIINRRFYNIVWFLISLWLDNKRIHWSWWIPLSASTRHKVISGVFKTWGQPTSLYCCYCFRNRRKTLLPPSLRNLGYDSSLRKICEFCKYFEAILVLDRRAVSGQQSDWIKFALDKLCGAGSKELSIYCAYTRQSPGQNVRVDGCTDDICLGGSYVWVTFLRVRADVWDDICPP